MGDLMMFNLSAEQLEELNAVHTSKEIYQQPSVWEELTNNYFERQDEYKEFLHSIYNKHEEVRVIFSGAGTSAFIGDILVPELSKQGLKNVKFESIATTNVVSNPTEYLFEDSPTILVSFARSGNSPESVATVALAEKIVKDLYQVIVTCNPKGELAKNVEGDENSLTILMPERANDQSLAMTSSFSSMILTAFAIFTDDLYTEESSQRLVSL